MDTSSSYFSTTIRTNCLLCEWFIAVSGQELKIMAAHDSDFFWEVGRVLISGMRSTVLHSAYRYAMALIAAGTITRLSYPA
jgi:hypothetical protein